MQARSPKAIHIISLGCCALCAQSIFVRELVALFSGSEFVIGALLAGWLFWVGAGALLGGRIISARNAAGFSLFAALAILIAILVPVTVVCIRIGRGLIARPPGVLPPLGVALGFSFLVVAPFGFIYGAIYNVASVLWKESSGSIRGGISRVYLWEAVGSCCGAVIFSFILIAFFSQFQAALVAAFILLLAVALQRAPAAERLRYAVGVLALSFLAGLLSPSIDRESMAFVYRGYRIQRFGSSRYGEIVVASQAEVSSVFAGGGRLFSYPEPERTQEMIHVPLLLCPEPRSVLLVGSSLGGGWEEALKHRSVERLDCIELDGNLFEAGADAREAFRRARGVRFIAADGRFFLSRGEHRYDCIILASPPPVNLQWNRFYTKEFFETAQRSLAPGGVFAFTHPASENYLTGAQARVLRTIELTLKAVFKNVTTLPGSTVHFIASASEIDSGAIAGRLKERHIDAPFVSEDYLPFRFSRERINALEADLARAGAPAINTDEKPSLPLRELVLEGSKIGSPLIEFLGAAVTMPPYLIGGILVASLLILFAGSRPGAKARLAVWSVGCAGFLLQLLVLLSYQSFSGLLYHAIVLLTALFMAGAATGAFASMRHPAWGGGSLRAMHFGFMLVAAALPAWTFMLERFGLSYRAGSFGFFLCAVGGGFLTGAYYPVVVRTAFPERGGAVPATFYAWDIFGACVGGVAGGLILFPVLGLAGTALCIGMIHVLAVSFLAGRWRASGS